MGIASLIREDLMRKDRTKRAGQDADITRARIGVAGRQSVVDTQQAGGAEREEMGQESATARQNIIAQSNKIVQGMRNRSATNVQGMRNTAAIKTEGMRNKTALEGVDKRGRNALLSIREQGMEQRWIDEDKATTSYQQGQRSLMNTPVIDATSFVPQVATPTTTVNGKKKKNEYLEFN